MQGLGPLGYRVHCSGTLLYRTVLNTYTPSCFIRRHGFRPILGNRNKPKEGVMGAQEVDNFLLLCFFLLYYFLTNSSRAILSLIGVSYQLYIVPIEPGQHS